jgi:glucose/arabinose dehydrogenase
MVTATRMPRGIRIPTLAALTAAVLAMTACTGAPERTPTSAAPTPSSASPAPTAQGGLWAPTGSVTTLAKDLDAPWSVVPLEGGGALIGQRDDAHVRELTADGSLRDVGTISDVDAAGEGGLLGLALWTDPADTQVWLYAYATSPSDNRVVRAKLAGAPGSYTIGPAEAVLDGIRKASNHNGGRIAFGPDGFLYVTTGDANHRPDAQDKASLNGKILRITPIGEPAPGNPFGNPVYSLGHRNVQGIAWTSDGTMWASEFGQDTWDELNVISPGANYGWPTVEGRSDDDRFTDPVAQWRTDDASPSGMAAVGDTLFIAALKGTRLWVADTRGTELVGEPRAVLEGEQGRLRDAVAAPDGSLWVLTNNTDGRGDPRAGDDLLLDLPLAPAS